MDNIYNWNEESCFRLLGVKSYFRVNKFELIVLGSTIK